MTRFARHLDFGFPRCSALSLVSLLAAQAPCRGTLSRKASIKCSAPSFLQSGWRVLKPIVAAAYEPNSRVASMEGFRISEWKV